MIVFSINITCLIHYAVQKSRKYSAYRGVLKLEIVQFHSYLHSFQITPGGTLRQGLAYRGRGRGVGGTLKLGSAYRGGGRELKQVIWKRKQIIFNLPPRHLGP